MTRPTDDQRRPGEASDQARLASPFLEHDVGLAGLVERRVSEVVARVAGLAALRPDELGASLFLELGLDSLATIDMADHLELEFGVLINNGYLMLLDTPRKIIDYVLGQLAGPCQAGPSPAGSILGHGSCN